MKKLSVYLKGLYKECFFGPFLKLAEACLELFVPFVIMDILDKGVKNGDVKRVVLMMLLLVFMGLCGLVFSVSAQFFCSKAATTFSSRVRKELYNKILSLPSEKTDGIGKSTLITRLTGDVDQVQTGLNLALRLLLRAPVIVFGALILAFTVSVKGALVFCVLIPLLLIVVLSVILTASPIQSKTRKILDELTLICRENLSGIRVIRALSLTKSEREKFGGVSDENERNEIKAGRIFALLNPLTYVIVNICIVVLVYIGASLFSLGLIEIGGIIALYNYMTQILAELIKLANLIINISKATVCGRRITSVLSEESEKGVEYHDGAVVPPSIVFDNVTFSYHKNAEPAVKNMSFTINPGEHIGIIGVTGSGKSTVIRLICGTYKCDAGKITCGGNDVSLLDGVSYRRSLGVVPQKSEMFAGTVRSNMLLCREDATDDEIASALESAEAYSFVTEYGGLDMEIYQGGKNLSGGQRQRLAIARALLRKSKMLIFDDSFSALDYITEKKLRQKIEKMTDTTVIIVSQRVSSVVSCDKIMLVDDGKIVAFDTHDGLLSSCPEYCELVKSQTGGEDEKA